MSLFLLYFPDWHFLDSASLLGSTGFFYNPNCGNNQDTKLIRVCWRHGHTVRVHSVSLFKVLAVCSRPPGPLQGLPSVLLPLFLSENGMGSGGTPASSVALQAPTLHTKLGVSEPWDVSFTFINILAVLWILSLEKTWYVSMFPRQGSRKDILGESLHKKGGITGW